MYVIFSYLMPFMMAFAESGSGAAAPSGPAFIVEAVKWAAGLGGGIVAIFLVVSLVKDGIEFAKGQGSSSIWKILGKAIFLIVMIGLIYVAQNYSTLGTKTQAVAERAVNNVTNEASKLIK